MSKQITTQDKQRIFALYWGQKVGVYKQTTATTYVSAVQPNQSNILHLLVTPLSDITNRDAIEVARILDLWVDFTDKVYPDGDLEYPMCKENFIDHLLPLFDNDYPRHNGRDILTVVDFLRSRGYALPAFGWSVDELVAAGVFKLKSKDNE